MARYNLGEVRPHVQAAADEIGGRFGVRTVLGVGDRPTPGSDHPKGLALDFMVGAATGDQLAGYVQANAARLGVTYVIWRQRLWSAGRADEGWRPMADRGSPTANHYDHVHVSFAPAPAGSVTMPAVSPAPGADPAIVAGLLDPLPWLTDKLTGQLDEAGAAIVRAVTGYVLAGVLVAGGLALVVVGLSRSASNRKATQT